MADTDLQEAVSIAPDIWAPLSSYAVTVSVARDGAVLSVPLDQFIRLVSMLRDDARYEYQQLIDITAVDYPGRTPRFDVVYHFLSLTKNTRVRVKVPTDEVTPVPSLVPLYPCANWFEREVYDMFGIVFEGHPDLRRILTDYGFVGHPLRKEFPLTGHVEVRYDDKLARVVYEPVHLQQDFRMMDFESPWEGMTNVQLPGDEKKTKPAGWLDRRPLIAGMVEGKE